MADDSSQEKTEQATPKRMEKSREEGQIPRSRELTTSALLLGGTIGLYVFGVHMAESLMNIMRFNFDLERETIFNINLMTQQLGVSLGEGIRSLLPLFFVLVMASIVGPIALGGWLLSSKAMMPKFSRMDPVAGLKRMFSLKSLMELTKALVKVLIILTVVIAFLSAYEGSLLALSGQAVESAVAGALQISVWAAILLSAVTIVVALVDVPFQLWDHSQKLKMSRQDIKDEMKDSEGKPEVKSRIRQIQREIANRRMMAAVPEADVVITNPTHYSVALKYNPDTMNTPILLAKGVDLVALKIREIAVANQVEIVESPVLARSIYHTTEIEQEIPKGLYMAVAQVLAYVFQLRNFRHGKGQKPQRPRNIRVPPDLRH